MKYLMGFGVLVVAWLVGVFGFSQIVGSLQNIRSRSTGATAFTILFWGAILAVVCFVAHRFFLDYRIVYYIGTGLSLLQVLSAGRIH